MIRSTVRYDGGEYNHILWECDGCGRRVRVFTRYVVNPRLPRGWERVGEKHACTNDCANVIGRPETYLAEYVVARAMLDALCDEIDTARQLRRVRGTRGGDASARRSERVAYAVEARQPRPRRAEVSEMATEWKQNGARWIEAQVGALGLELERSIDPEAGDGWVWRARRNISIVASGMIYERSTSDEFDAVRGESVVTWACDEARARTIVERFGAALGADS